MTNCDVCTLKRGTWFHRWQIQEYKNKLKEHNILYVIFVPIHEKAKKVSDFIALLISWDVYSQSHNSHIPCSNIQETIYKLLWFIQDTTNSDYLCLFIEFVFLKVNHYFSVPIFHSKYHQHLNILEIYWPTNLQSINNPFWKHQQKRI